MGQAAASSAVSSAGPPTTRNPIASSSWAFAASPASIRKVTEQVVDGNSDAIFDWPWIFVEDAGAWSITQARGDLRLREYLQRGGFIFLDDTHGDYEWANLLRVTNAIFPGRRIEDLQNSDELFHVLYDLDKRFQIPGTRFIWGGRGYSPDESCA